MKQGRLENFMVRVAEDLQAKLLKDKREVTQGFYVKARRTGAGCIDGRSIKVN